MKLCLPVLVAALLASCPFLATPSLVGCAPGAPGRSEEAEQEGATVRRERAEAGPVGEAPEDSEPSESDGRTREPHAVPGPSGQTFRSVDVNSAGCLSISLGETPGALEACDVGHCIRPGSDVRWTADGATFVAWGAGSDDAVGLLLEPDCSIRLSLAAPVVRLSPDGRGIVTFSGPGNPLAALTAPRLWDVANGSLVWEGSSSECGRVIAVRWEDLRVVLDCETPAGFHQAVVERLRADRLVEP